MTRYVGYTMGYERSFNFAVLPSEAKERDFAIIENIIVNKGLHESSRLYLLEEIKNKPHFLRVSVF